MKLKITSKVIKIMLKDIGKLFVGLWGGIKTIPWFDILICVGIAMLFLSITTLFVYLLTGCYISVWLWWVTKITLGSVFSFGSVMWGRSIKKRIDK